MEYCDMCGSEDVVILRNDMECLNCGCNYIDFYLACKIGEVVDNSG